MTAEHFEVLVEEPSMEAFLGQLLPRLIGERATFTIHPHQGKSDLLSKLAPRLRGYASWMPATCRIVVVVDRDDDDCRTLKARLEKDAGIARLRTRSQAGGTAWQVVNRIAIEELEAWYFGDWQAVRQVYPAVGPTIPRQAPYRDPDAVAGGTWEAFERVLKGAGYFTTGLRKLEAARAIGARMDPAANTSPSFVHFRDVLLEAMA